MFMASTHFVDKQIKRILSSLAEPEPHYTLVKNEQEPDAVLAETLVKTCTH
jgi:hypothetical protein